MCVSSAPGGRGYSQKSWVGACGSLPKTLTLLMTKICYCCYPIYDLPKIPYRIYDLCSWDSCPKHTVLLIMMKKYRKQRAVTNIIHRQRMV